MSEDHKNLVTFYSGLAMLGLLLRSKGEINEQQLAEDSFQIAEFMATEHRRISDGSYSE